MWFSVRAVINTPRTRKWIIIGIFMLMPLVKERFFLRRTAGFKICGASGARYHNVVSLKSFLASC